VSELCFVDDEVTYDVCRVVQSRHAVCRWNVFDREAAVDDVLGTVTGVLIDDTCTIVVPLYE